MIGKVLFIVVVTLSAVLADKPASTPGQSTPPPRPRPPTKAEIKKACESCHENLLQCFEYNFETVDYKNTFKTWATCVKDAIKEWRKAASASVGIQGMKYWPDASIMTAGEVGVPKGSFGRIECVNERFFFSDTYQSQSGCLSCHAYTPTASAAFEDVSENCNGQ